MRRENRREEEIMDKRGRFIVFEGIDGSGKSTQLQMLKDRLETAGIPCSETREPTDSVFGKLLRDVLTKKVKADNRVLAPLFAADRMDHILREEEGLLAVREKGNVILCDRYYFSNYAYQSTSLPLQYVISVNEPCAALMRPDLTFFIDVSPKTAMERINTNRGQTELFEKEEILEKTRNQYLSAFEAVKDTENVKIIDGSRSPQDIADEILAIVVDEMPDLMVK